MPNIYYPYLKIAMLISIESDLPIFGDFTVIRKAVVVLVEFV